jgi:hypothetical protein
MRIVVCVWVSQGLGTVRHPRSHSVTAATAPLLLAIRLVTTQKPGLKARALPFITKLQHGEHANVWDRSVTLCRTKRFLFSSESRPALAPAQPSVQLVHRSKTVGALRWPQGRAIAQVVSRWLPTAAARVRSQVRSCGICGGHSTLCLRNVVWWKTVKQCETSVKVYFTGYKVRTWRRY